MRGRGFAYKSRRLPPPRSQAAPRGFARPQLAKHRCGLLRASSAQPGEILYARRGRLAEFPVRNEAVHSEPSREQSS